MLNYENINLVSYFQTPLKAVSLQTVLEFILRDNKTSKLVLLHCAGTTHKTLRVLWKIRVHSLWVEKKLWPANPAFNEAPWSFNFKHFGFFWPCHCKLRVSKNYDLGAYSYFCTVDADICGSVDECLHFSNVGSKVFVD